jgi:hypothetical protein
LLSLFTARHPLCVLLDQPTLSWCSAGSNP